MIDEEFNTYPSFRTTKSFPVFSNCIYFALFLLLQTHSFSIFTSRTTKANWNSYANWIKKNKAEKKENVQLVMLKYFKS